MANYAVVDHTTKIGPLKVVAAALETYLETVDDSYTIHLVSVQPVGSGMFQGVVIHNAS
jgi:hypothetical protein|tara:strand:+ start:4594 stop:4770 length:177 start_codon:yes stop_codon:yes gene_type:complete